MIPGGYYSHNIPPAKHNKGAVIQVIDQKGALYRSDGEFWVPLAAVEAPAGSTFVTAATPSSGGSGISAAPGKTMLSGGSGVLASGLGEYGEYIIAPHKTKSVPSVRRKSSPP